MNRLTLGSRGSELALLQSKQVMNMLLEHYPHMEININIIRTQGDINLDKSLNEIGGKAAFTAELEDALINHHIDLAVHSLKDLPSTLSGDLIYLGSPGREDPRDVFVSTKWKTINEVPKGGTIATGSSRRKAQLIHHRPDFNIQGLRGNIDTRLRKLDEYKWDGIITAAAAMHRMGMKDKISEYLNLTDFVPSGGQGALGLESAANREDIKPIINAIINEETTQCCNAERSYLAHMEAGCSMPIGCWGRIEDHVFHLTGFCSSLDGIHKIQETVKGDIKDAEKLSLNLAEIMIQRGAREIMAQ